MLIPDCRNDEYYNEDFLSGDDYEFIRGFDWCAEQAVDNLFNNLDIYFSDESPVIEAFNKKLPENMRSEETIEWTFGDRQPITRKIETYGDFFRSKIQEYIEMERDELITSMIDNMDQDIYNALRNKMIKENEKKEEKDKKHYRDTRSFRK